jgi:Zn finger protein HypA/HybF involved in hydrogenase expression
MHETRFVNEIIAVLKEQKGKGDGSGRAVVTVRLSPFSHVSADNLRGAYEALVKGAEFHDVELNILPLEILLVCKSCKRSSRVAKRVFGCPFCNSADVDIQMDKEFFVESIEIECG